MTWGWGWVIAMLEQLSEQVRECYERAAEAKANAGASNDPALKTSYLDLERSWLLLARSFGATESLDDFTREISKRRKASDKRLLPNIEWLWKSKSNRAGQILWSIVENNDDAIITMNLNGIISSWNKSAERIFGFPGEEVIGKPVTILIPPERDHEELPILASLKRGEHVDHYETVFLRKDGSYLDISLTVSPIKNAQGKIIGASKIARDITERKRSDAHIALLGREAEHRTANILATVQAIVTLSQAATIDDFKVAIEARLRALAGVHSLFVESRWAGAELSSIVTQELAPYLGKGKGRAQMDGANVLLSTNTAQAIAITLHELATNAAKYGALSVPEGHLCVKWALSANEQLTLRWTENGGPLTKAPTREGFGMSVIKRMVRQECEVHFDWRSEGLVCEIVLEI